MLSSARTEWSLCLRCQNDQIVRKILGAFDVTILPRLAWQNRSLLRQVTLRNVEQRYKGSFLGLVWSFVQPLVMLCVYTFVFSWLMGAKWGVEGSDWGLDVENSKTAFAIIMLAGLAVFTLFSESLSFCTFVVSGNPNLVKKVIFPLEILPLAQAMSTFILGIAWVVILLLGVVFFFGRFSWTMLLLPVIWLPLFLLTVGLSYVVASLGVYLRDTSYIVSICTQLLFWAIPIVYPIRLLHDKMKTLAPVLKSVLTWGVERNPLSVVVEQTRQVFLFGQLPDWFGYGAVLAFSFLVLQFGFAFFVRTKRGFADVL